jgi:hypothetical protein
MRWTGVAAALCLWAATAGELYAHAFAPSLLALREGGNGEVAVMWKTPRLRVIGSDVRPQLPAACRDLTAPVVEETDVALTLRWQVDCGEAGLVGSRIGIDGLATANTNGLIRVALADGRLIQQVVTITQPSLVIPTPPRQADIAFDYGRSGVMHVLTRADRLLFVLGLLLLAPAPRRMAQTLIAFTLGHSLTLPAAIFGLVPIPTSAIEIVLAVTILTLATELARAPSRTWTRRFPWTMGFAFGLVHGLGFAAALRTGGLPAGDVALAVLSFNAGIEIGQLACVAVVLVMMRLLRALPRPLPGWARQVPVYVIGSFGAFWCFERAAALLR